MTVFDERSKESESVHNCDVSYRKQELREISSEFHLAEWSRKILEISREKLFLGAKTQQRTHSLYRTTFSKNRRAR